MSRWSEKSLKKMSLKKRGISRPNFSGENHPNWKGGVSSEAQRERQTAKYKEFKRIIFETHENKCSFCDSTQSLEVDHIKPHYLYPELLCDVNNGRLLCKKCHRKRSTEQIRLVWIFIRQFRGEFDSFMDNVSQ